MAEAWSYGRGMELAIGNSGTRSACGIGADSGPGTGSIGVRSTASSQAWVMAREPAHGGEDRGRAHA